MYAQKDGDGSGQGDVKKTHPEKTEFKERQMGSERDKQIEVFIEDMSRVFKYLNSTTGVWRNVAGEKTLLDLAKESAKDTHDKKFEGAVASFCEDLKRDCLKSISAEGGFQSKSLKNIRQFLRDNDYFFSISQGKQSADISVDDMKEYMFTQRGIGFSANYVFGKIDESKIRGYGNTGVRVDFLKDVVTNIKYLSGRADQFGSESVAVVRNNAYIAFTDRLERNLEEMKSEKREVVNNFDKLGDDDINKWAQKERPDNPSAAVAEVVLMKLAQNYVHKDGETREQFLDRARKDGEGFIESHELMEKIIMLYQYGPKSFMREKKEFGGRTIELISGPPTFNLSAESAFKGWEREMVSDMLALAEHPSVAILKQMDEYLTMIRKDPADAEKIDKMRRYYESSVGIIERVVNYVEDNRGKFPNVHKSGVLAVGELSDEQLSSIAKILIEVEYKGKGQVFDYSLVF